MVHISVFPAFIHIALMYDAASFDDTELFAVQVNWVRHIHHVHHSATGIMKFPYLFSTQLNNLFISHILHFKYPTIYRPLHMLHGDMLAVGGKFPLLEDGSLDGNNDGNTRRPWIDLPRCQSCHTGDAVDYLNQPDLVADPDWPFRLRQAFATVDDSATPLLATNKRFAEDPNTLFRFSKGHGEISCEGCHGSTHAIWPNATKSANDNVAATQLQGFTGTLIDCTVCHQAGGMPTGTDGQHGLHSVKDPRWYDDGHEVFTRPARTAAKACHGLNLAGTPLARMPTERRMRIEDNEVVAFENGEFVRCDRCHEMPEL